MLPGMRVRLLSRALALTSAAQNCQQSGGPHHGPKQTTRQKADQISVSMGFFIPLLRTFFECKGFTKEATNWLNVVIASHSYSNSTFEVSHWFDQ